MTTGHLHKWVPRTGAIFILIVTCPSLLLAQGPSSETPKSQIVDSENDVAATPSGLRAAQPIAATTGVFSITSLPSAPIAPPASAIVASSLRAPTTERPRRFFDQWNIVLFTSTAALDFTDFAVTRANLQNNGKELNPIVRMFGRSTLGLAFNFAGEAAGTVGLSYFFHRTGHYKLERIVSLVNIGATSGAVSYSASHR
jgi:hypothetical protein